MAYETNAWGLDLSHYDDKVDAAKLAGVVDFLTLKAGGSESAGGPYTDVHFAERVQMAYDIQVPCGAYWFVGPRFWLEKQQTFTGIDNLTDDKHPLLQYVMGVLKNKFIHWLAFDVEEPSLWTSSGQVTDTWVRFYIADLVERIQRQQAKGNLRPFKMGVYSRRQFMDTTQAALNTYLGAQPSLFLWPANWVTGTGETAPLADLKANHRPSAAHIPYSFGWCADRPQTWQFWQWSGDSGRVYKSDAVTNAAGIPRGLDINLFNGTVEQMKVWAGIITPPAPPAPEPPPVVPPVVVPGTYTTKELALLDALRAWKAS